MSPAGVKSVSHGLRYTRDDEKMPAISGWLVKEGKTMKQQKPRFLKLENSILSNHKDVNLPATWSVSILDCMVGPGPRKNELLVNLPKRRVSFFADSSADYQRWIFALKKGSASNFILESFYRIGDVIGEGINGEVLMGRDKVTSERVAIKSVPYEGDMSLAEDVEAEEEIRIVKSLNHPNLVRTYDVFRDTTKKKTYIVMEYVAGGELFARVAGESGSMIKEGDAARIARNILDSLVYLHKQNIVHRDIKLENILCLDEDEQKPVQVKLADFGLSSKLSGKSPTLNSLVGTSFYLAPEIISKAGYGASVDMWACGIVLYIMLSGQFPFCGDNDEEYYKNVVEQALEFPDSEWGTVSPDAIDFIRDLLDKNPETRKTAEDALGHKWLQETDTDLFGGSGGGETEEEMMAAPKVCERRYGRILWLLEVLHSTLWTLIERLTERVFVPVRGPAGM